MAQGSHKTYFVINPNSIYHIFSKLFDRVDLTSHLIFVKNYLTGSLCFYGFHGEERQIKLENLFHTILKTLYKKDPKKTLRRSKIGGGVRVNLSTFKDSIFFFTFSNLLVGKER